MRGTTHLEKIGIYEQQAEFDQDQHSVRLLSGIEICQTLIFDKERT